MLNQRMLNEGTKLDKLVEQLKDAFKRYPQAFDSWRKFSSDISSHIVALGNIKSPKC